MSELRIGISGWRYEPWRGEFYPEKLPQRLELAYASRVLNSIEINGSFYSLQRPSSYREWYEQTPKDFVFSMKGGQFITHLRRLREIDEPLANFFASGLLLLREKLGPILWQFPPNFKWDADRFEQFFELLPTDTDEAAKLARKHGKQMIKAKRWTETDARRPIRYAVEIRHASFCNDAFIKLLRKFKIAVVVADTAGKWPYIEEMTSDFAYVRLHGDEQIYVSGYTDDALDQWAKRVKQWRKARDIYIYFDNDLKVRAPFDAIGLAKRLGLEFTRPAIDHLPGTSSKKPTPSRLR